MKHTTLSDPFVGLRVGPGSVVCSRLVGVGRRGVVCAVARDRTSDDDDCQSVVKFRPADVESGASVRTTADVEDTAIRIADGAVVVAIPPHPNVLTDIKLSNSPLVGATVTMPLATHGNLSKWLSAKHAAGTLDMKTRIGMCVEIALGLTHLHETGLTHSCLHPRNVLVFEDDVPMLSDYHQLVEVLPPPATASHRQASIVTAVTLQNGRYLPPEFVTRSTLGREADSWSLGLLIAEILAYPVKIRATFPSKIKSCSDTGFLSLIGQVKLRTRWASEDTPRRQPTPPAEQRPEDAGEERKDDKRQDDDEEQHQQKQPNDDDKHDDKHADAHHEAHHEADDADADADRPEEKAPSSPTPTSSPTPVVVVVVEPRVPTTPPPPSTAASTLPDDSPEADVPPETIQLLHNFRILLAHLLSEEPSRRLPVVEAATVLVALSQAVLAPPFFRQLHATLILTLSGLEVTLGRARWNLVHGGRPGTAQRLYQQWLSKAEHSTRVPFSTTFCVRVELCMALLRAGMVPEGVETLSHVLNMAHTQNRRNPDFCPTRIVTKALFSVNSEGDVEDVIHCAGVSKLLEDDAVAREVLVGLCGTSNSVAAMQFADYLFTGLVHWVKGDDLDPRHLEVEAVSQARIAALQEPNSAGMTAVLAASARGHVELLNLLLSNGGSPSALLMPAEVSPLYLAAKAGHHDVIEALLVACKARDCRRLLMYPTATGVTPVWIAAARGHLTSLMTLLQFGGDPNTVRVGDRLSALQVATLRRHTKCVDALLTAGADMNHVDLIWRQPALQLAARLGFLDIVSILVSRGADPNVVSPIDGSTPILAACLRGNTAVVEVLLLNGGKLLPRMDGLTPLMAAVLGGSVPLVDLLLRKHNDVLDSVTREFRPSGESPLMVAARSGRKGAEMLRAMLSYSVHVNIVSSQSGASPLWAAVASGSVDTALQLALHGADPDSGPVSPLWIAAAAGDLDLVQILHQIKVDVKAAVHPDDGSTALAAAADGGHLAVVKYMVRHMKADVNQVVKAAKEEEEEKKSTDEEESTVVKAAAVTMSKSTATRIAKGELEVDKETQEDIETLSGSALFRAARQGWLPVVQYLLRHGANPMLRRAGDRLLPVDVARKYGLDPVVTALEAGMETWKQRVAAGTIGAVGGDDDRKASTASVAKSRLRRLFMKR